MENQDLELINRANELAARTVAATALTELGNPADITCNQEVPNLVIPFAIYNEKERLFSVLFTSWLISKGKILFTFDEFNILLRLFCHDLKELLTLIDK